MKTLPTDKSDQSKLNSIASKPEWSKPELIKLDGNDANGKTSTRSSERFPSVGPS